MRIRWKNSVTDYFTKNNGVHQGCVFSLVLLSLYLEQFIFQLRHIGMDSYMNGIITGVLILVTLPYWHHKEQGWLLCWNSVRVFENTRHFVRRFEN